MNKLIPATIALALMTGLGASSALAQSRHFKVSQDANVNGATLETGKTYRLELNGNNEARIYHNSKLVATAQVEVKPLAKGQHRNSVSVWSDGTLLSIRTKNEVVIFAAPPEPQGRPAAALQPVLFSSVVVADLALPAARA
ncbi:MAG: hypothetical protein ACRD4D_06325 [Candidatus Acidiferrales bacterium]